YGAGRQIVTTSWLLPARTHVATTATVPDGSSGLPSGPTPAANTSTLRGAQPSGRWVAGAFAPAAAHTRASPLIRSVDPRAPSGATAYGLVRFAHAVWYPKRTIVCPFRCASWNACSS